MNDYLNPNLDSLIQKVHDEGIEKVKEEAQQIVAIAKQRADELLKEAEHQISKMEAKSLDEVNRHRDNIYSELKAAAQQTVNTIKNELADVVSSKISSYGIYEALSEKEFMQKMIFTVLQKWEPSDQLELLLNKNDEAQLHEYFEQEVKKHLKNEMEIVIEDKIKSGFKIAIKNEDYYVSFSDEDFEKFFKSYLRKKTLEWIFGTKNNEHE